MASQAQAELRAETEDVLAYLPATGTTEYSKGHVIYGPMNPSHCLHLVVTGNVRISQIARNGSEVVLDIVRPEELFGESAFLESPRRSERAIAIEKVKLMTWAISDMEDLVMKRPRLAVALLKVFALRNAESRCRIESFSIDTVERRLARALIRFSERLGTLDEDGFVRMMPLTHEMLSRYVGTSREVICNYMNHFRKRGFVSYSRHAILLRRGPLESWLECGAIPSNRIGYWGAGVPAGGRHD